MCWKLTAVYHNIIKLYVRMVQFLPPIKLLSIVLQNVLVCMRSAGLTVLVHSVARLKKKSRTEKLYNFENEQKRIMLEY